MIDVQSVLIGAGIVAGLWIVLDRLGWLTSHYAKRLRERRR